MTSVPLYRPLITEGDIGAVGTAMQSGQLGMGSVVAAFEERLRTTLGLRDGRELAAVSTGHAALHLALVVAGIGPGDEVITPSLTHLADVQAIAAVGATPVFCDIDDDTLCIDLDEAASMVTERTRAVMVVDYGCHLCDHDALARLAAENGLRVVHDAAHSFGSCYRGRPVGTFSDLCVFSFDPAKAVTCIDAGVLVVPNEDDMHRVHRLRRLGSTEAASAMYRGEREWVFDARETGFRYHLSNIHAALGMAQLEKLGLITSSRQDACRRYAANLGSIEWVQLPDTDFADVNPFLFYIRVPSELRDALRSHLSVSGIETGIHWYPAHRLSAFVDAPSGTLAVTEKAASELVSLPLHSGMDLEVVDFVSEAVANFTR